MESIIGSPEVTNLLLAFMCLGHLRFSNRLTKIETERANCPHKIALE